MTANESKSRTLMVLGMHRSGTSALAGLLHHLGLELGNQLLDAQADVNEKGFWEHRDFVTIHDRLLHKLGARWDSIHALPKHWWTREDMAPFHENIRDVIQREFHTSSLWALKDPRMCRLVPLWLDILASIGSTPIFVIIFRNPLEVAGSLQKRDSIEPSYALLLWLRHVLDSEYYSRKFPRIFLSYDELLRDWEDAVERISACLSFTWPNNPESVDEKINQFLDVNLKHFHADADQLKNQPGVSPWIKEAYELLLQATESDNQSLRRKFSVLRRTLEDATQLFNPAIESQARRLTRVEEGFHQAQHMLETFKKDLAHISERSSEVDKGFNQAVNMLKERDAQLLAARKRLARLHDLEEALGGKEGNEEIELLSSASEKNKFYAGVIDLRVDNNSHTKMFRLIQEDCAEHSKRILEVGCASGYFGAVLRERGHHVWGIEVSPEEVDKARLQLDHVFAGKIEDFLANEAFEGIKFDYIVFGDVLEHLVAPLAVLARCRHLLSVHGAIVASIPNVAHKSVRAMLLEGRWEYADFGILDDTHLRFFTRDSIVHLFLQAGFEIQNLDAVVLPTELTGIAVNHDVLEKVSDIVKDEDQEVFQFTLLARKSVHTSQEITKNNTRFTRNKGNRILCLLPFADWSVGNIRIRAPLKKMIQCYGGYLRIRQINDHRQEDFEWADTIVFQRESNAYVLGLLDTLHSMGKRILFDMDDLLTDVPRFLTVHEHCQRMRPYLEEALRMADAITVTTPRLQEKLQVYNENVFVVPNCTYSVHPPIRHHENGSAEVSLVVASTDTIRVDFIVDALKTLMNDTDLNLRLIGIGPPARFLEQSGLKVEAHGIMTHDQFKAFLATLHNAIGIIPLDDSQFSRCKSAIKFLELSLAGIPVVCSNVPPYSDVLIDGETGRLCENRTNDWYQTVKELALSNTERTALASNAREYCLRDFPLRYAADSWFEAVQNTHPGQGQSGSKLATKYRQMVLLQQLSQPSRYLAALRVLKNEGWRGLGARVRQYL